MNKENDGVLTPTAKKLIIPISDNSDFFEAADFAVIELNADRIDRIRKLSAVVRELEVYRISEFNYDCAFMVADYEADPENGKVTMKEFEGRTECNTLNVTDNDFFWSGYYKHTSVRWESASVSLEVLDSDGDYDLREVANDEQEAA
jgi:hypothetical protein